MKTVKILGAGCSKCNLLEARVRDVIEKNGIDAVVEKIADLDVMMDYGIMMTPGLVIDEEVKSFGSLPSADAIRQWLGVA
jgi:small redox-active disulfide protein 2